MLTQVQLWEAANAIPALPPIPPHWRLHLWPALTGAVVRFGVSFTGELDLNVGKGLISVYFGAYDKTGPYWELYPNAEGGTSRFPAGDEVALFAAIEAALQEQKI